MARMAERQFRDAEACDAPEPPPTAATEKRGSDPPLFQPDSTVRLPESRILPCWAAPLTPHVEPTNARTHEDFHPFHTGRPARRRTAGRHKRRNKPSGGVRHLRRMSRICLSRCRLQRQPACARPQRQSLRRGTRRSQGCPRGRICGSLRQPEPAGRQRGDSTLDGPALPAAGPLGSPSGSRPPQCGRTVCPFGLGETTPRTADQTCRSPHQRIDRPTEQRKPDRPKNANQPQPNPSRRPTSTCRWSS